MRWRAEKDYAPPMARTVDDDEGIRAILTRCRTIAVVGVHHEPHRAAFYVPDYLRSVGYRVLGVNPALAGRELFGETVVATLGDLTEPVDLVDVFRRSDRVPDHLEQLLAMRPLPSVVWLQLGIRHDATAAALVEAGVDVVQDRCTLADHRRLLGA